MYRGAVYADIHRYQRCVDLWKYAYILRHQKGDPLKHECLFTVQALVKLFWEMQVEVESGASDEKVCACAIYQCYEFTLRTVLVVYLSVPFY